MSKLRILAVGGRYSGVTYHRLALPLSIMKKEYCLITDTLSEELLVEKQINVLVINRYCEVVPLTEIVKWRAKLGFKLIVDIDDYWELFTQHLSYSVYKLNDVPSIIQNFIRYADLVTCTHSRLQAEIVKINKNCEVIPNGLPFDKDQFLNNKIEHERVTIAHTGSITHFPDIQQLKNPIKELAKSKAFKESCRMLLCGWHEYNAWHWNKIGNIFTANEQLDYKILEALPVDIYMNHYAEADMLLVPLLDNKFNRLKSNLKALEAGVRNIPVLAVNRDPYADIPTIFHVENWEIDIKQLSFSKQMREDYGNANGEYVRKHYDLFKINEKRLFIYEKLIE